MLCWGKGVGGYLWEEVEVYLIYGDMCIRRFVDRVDIFEEKFHALFACYVQFAIRRERR